MKKLIALLLTVTMLLAFACPVSFAEEDQDAKAQEVEAVLTWMTQDVSQENPEEILTWDRDTVLAKLEDYDQPLEYNTKEEIADQFLTVTSLFSLMQNMAENAEGSDPSELISGLFGGLLGGFVSADGDEADGFSDVPEWATVDEDGGWSYEINGLFDGTVWENDDTQITTEFFEGQYKVTIAQDGGTVTYMCDIDEYEQDDMWFSRLTGTDETGEQLFVTEDGRTLTWTQPDGTEAEFTLVVNPLTLFTWYGAEKTLTIEWRGEDNYIVLVDGYVNGEFWTCACVRDLTNEDTLTLVGASTKELYGDTEYTDGNATFTFSDDLIFITWHEDKTPETDDGLVFGQIDPAFTSDVWYNDQVDEVTGYFFDGQYIMTVMLGEERYSYVCDYDREAGTLTAVDPATLDPEMFGDYEYFRSTATFTLQGDHLLWLDDSGVSGQEGMLLECYQ